MYKIPMKRVVFLSVVFSFVFALSSMAAGQSDDPVLLKINEREITVSEFEYVYTKNNLNPQVLDPKSIDEYLELFVNFNLKVYEAMQLGLDTQATFISELDGYREQLAQPYLTDQEVSNQLLEEAYERMQWDLRASHILINLEEHASPADTLQAWNRIMEIRNKITEGENFEEIAREYSEDPSAKGMPATANRPAMRGNSGDLGYFSVLDMVYPFENAAYSLQIDEISAPVRTQFGYHIIKLTDKLPAMGRARVAHIMVQLPEDAGTEQTEQAETKIKEIYQEIKEGEDFESMAQRFSDDKASGRRGGELPPFTSNRMVPQFIKAISELDEQNNISKPLRTPYGWHIVKLFEKQTPSEDEAMAELKNKIGRDSRAALSQQVVIDRLKSEYDFTENPENLEVFFEKVDESVFEGKWDKNLMDENAEAILFAFADTVFSRADFAQYLSQTQTMRTPEAIRSYVSAMYSNFKNETILEYEEQRLPEKYPEFRKIMNEYHDGILLFELTDQKVWGKAMKDTAGLKQFFNNNIDDYMWDDRYDAVIYTFNTEQAAKSGRRQIRKAHRRNTPTEEIVASFNQSSQLEVSADKGVFETEEKPVLENLSPKSGISKVVEHNNSYHLVWVNDFIPAQPKKLSEVRGLVIADYQNYLEKKWVNELREKYEFTVYREALNSLQKQ